MAKGTKGAGLNFTAKLDTEEAKRRAAELKKIFSDLKISGPKTTTASFDTKPLTGYQQANMKLKQTLVAAQVEAQRLKNENLALAASYRQGQISAQQMAAAERQARTDRRQLAEASRAARLAQVAANGSYDEANNRLKALGRSIKAAEGGFKSTSPAIRAQINEYNTLNDALKRFDAQMGNHQRNVGNYRSAISGVIGDLRSLVVGYLSVQGALMAATKAFNVNRQSQAIEASLTYTLGSAEAATEKINELRKNALLLGQDFLPVAESYAKFAGAARAANFPIAETDRIFKAVSVAGARFNLTTDQMSGALLALQQMISKGTVQSEELRGQLGERLPGAFTIAAKAMGVSEQELGKLLQTGQVLASDLLPKLATQLEKEFGLKAGESIDNLNASVGRLSTTVDKALESDGFGRLAKYVVDATAGIITAFDKLMASRSVKEFFGRFFSLRSGDGPDDFIGGNSGNWADKINNIDDLIKTSAGTRKNFNPIGASSEIVISSLADKPLKDLEELRRKYITAATEASQAVNIYRKGIAKGILQDGDAKATLKEAEANFKSLSNILRQVNTAYNTVKARTPGESSVSSRTEGVIKAEIQALQDANKKLDVASLQFKVNVAKIKLLQKELKTALNGGVDPEAQRNQKRYDAALNARNSLQKNIDDLIKKGTYKQLSADEQEVESVRKKYADMKSAAVKFNNDPVNKKKGLRVDAGGLVRAEDREVTAVRDKQDTEKLKVSLDKQKQLYADFEAYKAEVGEENARARFGEELDANVTYLESLRAKRDEILNGDSKARGGSDVDTAGNRLKLKLLDEEIAAEVAANKRKEDEVFAYAYRSAMTHSQAMLAIENDYQRQVKALGAGATQEQIDNLKRQRDERVRSENEGNLEAKSGYAELLANFNAMSREKVIKELDREKEYWTKQYKDKLITAEFYSKKIAEIENFVTSLTGNNIFNSISRAIERYKKAKKAFEDATGEKDKKSASNGVLEAQANLFDEISQAAGSLNDVLATSANALNNLGIGGEELQSTFKNIMGVVSGAGSIAKGIASGNPVDIVTGSINLLSSAISLFNNKDKNLQKKIDGYQRQLNELGQAYKQLDRAVQNSVGESFYTDSAAQIANLQQQQAKLIQMRDAEASKKKKDQAKIDEYNNQIADIPNQIFDIQKAISENLIQTNFKELSNNLSDAFAEAFAAGEDSAESFEDVYNKVISNAIKNSLKLKILDPIVKKFTDDLTAYALANNNSIIGFDFNSYRKQLEDAGKLFQDGLKGSEEYFKDLEGDSGSAVKRDIEGIKSTQASALEGLARGQYDIQKKTFTIATDTNNNIGKIYAIGLKKLDALEAIKKNTADTVTELKSAVQELKAINGNTKSSPGSLRGAGLG